MRQQINNFPVFFQFHVLTMFGLIILCSNIIFGQDYHTFATQQPAVVRELDSAEKLYYNGEFDKAKSTVKNYLIEKPSSQFDRVRAYKILVRINLVQGDSVQANENARNLLTLDPAYEPTIEQETPNFVNLIAKVKNEQSQTKRKSKSSVWQFKRWLIFGAGGVATAAIIVLAGTGKEAGKDHQTEILPEPPDFP
jgi:hypothetical protein